MSLSNAQSVVVAYAMTGALLNGLTGRSMIGGAINGAISGMMVAGVGKISDTILGTEIMGTRNMSRNFTTTSKSTATNTRGFRGFSSMSSSIGRSANTSSF